MKDEFTRALTAPRIGCTAHRLLEYMMRRTDQLLTRHMLLNKVWGYKCIPTTNLVDVHTGQLRQMIDISGEIPLINKVRGAGFVLRPAGN